MILSTYSGNAHVERAMNPFSTLEHSLATNPDAAVKSTSLRRTLLYQQHGLYVHALSPP